MSSFNRFQESQGCDSDIQAREGAFRVHRVGPKAGPTRRCDSRRIPEEIRKQISSQGRRKSNKRVQMRLFIHHSVAFAGVHRWKVHRQRGRRCSSSAHRRVGSACSEGAGVDCDGSTSTCIMCTVPSKYFIKPVYVNA